MKMAELCNLSISDFYSANKYIATAKDYPMHNRGRLHHGLIYTFKGTETYIFEDCKIKAEPNTLVYLPKNSKYKITFEGEESVVITLEMEFCDNNINIEPFVIPFEENNPVEALFLKAENEWQSRKTACRAACLSIAYNIITVSARTEEKFIHPGKFERIREAVEYLHAHFTEQNFRIETLSEISGINSAYFARIFSDKFGMSPKEYVTELKLRRARELLSQEKYSVSDIGLLLGYSDVYHFSKSFKRGVGVSPIEWRNSYKNYT